MRGRVQVLTLSGEERTVPEHWARRPKSALRVALPRRIVLHSASGATNQDVAGSLRINRLTVGKWREHKILAGLDAQASERVIGKGADADHVKGQVLEELLETKIVSWFGDSAAAGALGVRTRGKPLKFISGPLIKGLDGRQLSDGLLVIRDGGVLEIVAVMQVSGQQSRSRVELLMQRLMGRDCGGELEPRAHASRMRVAKMLLTATQRPSAYCKVVG